MRYAQELDKIGFFSNVMTVLYLLALGGAYHAGAFSVSGEPSFDGSQAQRPAKWQDRRTNPDQEARLPLGEFSMDDQDKTKQQLMDELKELRQRVSKPEAVEEALRESEERLSRISSMTSDIAYSCAKLPSGDYAIDWLTGGAERLTGYSVDDLKSLGCWRFLVVDDDLPVFDTYVIGLAPGMKASCELRLRHKSGETLRIASFAECVADAESPGGLRLYGGWVDITERKKVEEALRDSEERFKDISEIIEEVFWMADVQIDTMLYVSPAYEKVWGRPVASLYREPEVLYRRDTRRGPGAGNSRFGSPEETFICSISSTA